MVDAALRAAGPSQRALHLAAPAAARGALRHRRRGSDAPTRWRPPAARIQQAVESLVASGELEALPTFFECTTAVAFDLFREARVDVAVLEVGLGGRLDSTNIVSPIAAAIVSIDFDHEEQLGHTLAAIAAEKAGVIKPGIPVVCGPLPAEALDVIARGLRRSKGRRSSGPTPTRRWPRGSRRCRSALAGAHQRANAAVAVRLLEAIDRDAVAAFAVGAERASARASRRRAWPGRLESFTVAASAGSCSTRRTTRPARARWRLISVRPHRTASRWCSARCATRRCARC